MLLPGLFVFLAGAVEVGRSGVAGRTAFSGLLREGRVGAGLLRTEHGDADNGERGRADQRHREAGPFRHFAIVHEILLLCAAGAADVSATVSAERGNGPGRAVVAPFDALTVPIGE